MYVFLDSNAYISAKYDFKCGILSQLVNLLETENIVVLYTAVNVGEVKEHIIVDIENAINPYNKLLGKYQKLLTQSRHTSLTKLDKQHVINCFMRDFKDFLSLKNVQQIKLNPIDAESLMADHFDKKFPFEARKQNEFKDAIMINALKQFQVECNEDIIIISDDKGFREALSKSKSFVFYKNLFEFNKKMNMAKESVFFEKSDYFIDCLLEKHLDSKIIDYFDKEKFIFEDYYECRVEGYSIYTGNYSLLSVSKNSDIYVVVFSCEIEAEIELIYLDEENSFFDNQKEEFILKKYLTAVETHKFDFEFCLNLNISFFSDDFIIDHFAINNKETTSDVFLSSFFTLISSYVEETD